MLSILIPTYNFNCYEIVTCLHKQATVENIPFEIIVMDDASTNPPKENEAISKLPNCSYIALKKNIGRSRIRNLLANTAKYDNLLFLDNDGAVRNDDFIHKYLRYLDDIVVVCGGRSYQDKAPEDKQFLLHWKYGRNREMIPLRKRLNSPYKSFLTNNFLIHKSVFKSVRFKENISQYGHEDTIFGIELKHAQIPVIHIDNPIEHIGLEPAETILQKEKDSIQNLITILTSTQHPNLVTQEIKLLKAYRFIYKIKMSSMIGYIFPLINKIVSSELITKHPVLNLLDIFKLSYLCSLANKTDNLSQNIFYDFD